MGCEYCQEYKHLDYFNGEDKKRNCVEITMAIVDGYLSYEVITSEFSRSNSIRLNYCPMCGQKLKENNE